jgi:hypothetical protein
MLVVSVVCSRGSRCGARGVKVRAGVLAAAQTFNHHEQPWGLIVDSSVATRSQIQACQQAVAPYPLRLIVLAPPVELSAQRDAQRSGKHVARLFAHLRPLIDSELGGLGLWIDNSAQSPLGTVRMILAQRADARLPS